MITTESIKTSLESVSHDKVPQIKLFIASLRRYMVDAADLDKMEASRNELHSLLDKPQLAGIPVLVLGNKRDLPGALEETGLIERMWESAHLMHTASC